MRPLCLRSDWPETSHEGTMTMSLQPADKPGSDAQRSRQKPPPESKAGNLKSPVERETRQEVAHGPADDSQCGHRRTGGLKDGSITARTHAQVYKKRAACRINPDAKAVRVESRPLRGGVDLPDIEAFNATRWANVRSYKEVASANMRLVQAASSAATRQANSPVAGATPKDGKIDNPCFNESYRTFEKVKDLVNEGVMTVTPAVGKKMTQLLDLHRDQQDVCCTIRSLTAFCRTDEEFKFVAERPWGLSSIPEFTKTIKDFCSSFGRAADLYELKSTEVVRTRIGDGDESDMEFFAFFVSHSVVEYGEEFGIHVVPVRFMRQDLLVRHSTLKKYAGIARKFDLYLEQMQANALEEVQRMMLAMAEPPSVVEPSDAVIKTEKQRPNTCEAAVQTEFPAPVISRWFPIERNPDGEVAFVDNRETNTRGSDSFVQTTEPHCCDTFVYRGPRSHMMGLDCPGNGNGYNSCAIIRPVVTTLKGFFDDLTTYPGLVWATLSNLRHFGTRVRYFITAKELNRVEIAGEAETILTADHTFVKNGVTYGFVRDDLEICCKRVESYSLAVMKSLTFRQYAWLRLGSLAEWVPAFGPDWSDVEIRHPGRSTGRQQFEALWQLEHLTESDPQNIALIARARSAALADPRAPDPIQSCAALRAMRRNYQSLPQVGGPFAWGFCYSCGAARPGKFRSRVCPTCARTNTAFGNMIALGESVCSQNSRVVYPGVVHKPRQTVPLKDAAETVARWGVDIGVRRCGKELSYDQVMQIPDRVNPLGGPTLGAVALDGAHPKVTAAGIRALVNAILYRVFKALPEDRHVNSSCFDTAIALAHSPALLGDFLRPDGIPMSVSAWIRSLSVSRRRRALLRALKLLEQRGRESDDFEFIKPFVKTELLSAFSAKSGFLQTNDFSLVADDSAAAAMARGDARPPVPHAEDVPRLIQAPEDETHLIAGPYLKPLVSRLKEQWGPENWIFYGSVGPDKLNRWLRRIAGCQSFFWSDYTAFDATFSPDTWRMIEGFYRCIYPDAPLEFWRVMDIWRTPRGKVKLRKEGVTVWYKAKVCNCSGRDDTALANALFNGLALSLSFAAALSGKDVPQLDEADVLNASLKIKISIVGDDSLVGCDFDVEPFVDAILRNLRSFGLVVKAEHSNELCDVTYLGQMPYLVNGKHFWGPTIGRCMYKLFWMREKEQGFSPSSWSRGVAQAFANYRHVPLLLELCQRVDRLLYGHAVLKEQVDLENQTWKIRPSGMPNWDLSTIDWLCMRYRGTGLSRELFKVDLATIETIDRLPAVVRLECLECILKSDDT